MSTTPAKVMNLFDWRKAMLSDMGPAPTTRLVLMVISTHMNGDGASCFPSITTLAAETGLSRRVVIEHIAKAAEDGWIRKAPKGLSGQAWRRHEYAASIPGNVVQQIHHLNQNVVTENNHVDQKRGDGELPPFDEGGYFGRKKVVTESNPSTSVNSSESAPAKKSKPKTTTAKRKTPAPDHLPVTDAMTAFAKSKGYTGDLAELTATFLDHHRAKGSLFIDWTAAWRTWLRNEIRFSANRPASHMTPTATAAEGHRGANLITGRSTHA